MIGLDTNVIVRYLVQDDVTQSSKSTLLIESLSTEEPGFVSLIVIVELVWVLSSAYGSTRREVAEVLHNLLRIRELHIEQAETVAAALCLYRLGKADFADCLIERTAMRTGCTTVMTFDKAAAKSCGMQLIN